jgi:hypothetical protein
VNANAPCVVLNMKMYEGGIFPYPGCVECR